MDRHWTLFMSRFDWLRCNCPSAAASTMCLLPASCLPAFHCAQSTHAVLLPLLLHPPAASTRWSAMTRPALPSPWRQTPSSCCRSRELQPSLARSCRWQAPWQRAASRRPRPSCHSCYQVLGQQATAQQGQRGRRAVWRTCRHWSLPLPKSLQRRLRGRLCCRQRRCPLRETSCRQARAVLVRLAGTGREAQRLTTCRRVCLAACLPVASALQSAVFPCVVRTAVLGQLALPPCLQTLTSAHSVPPSL